MAGVLRMKINRVGSMHKADKPCKHLKVHAPHVVHKWGMPST